jgi:chromosome segregation ATPase
MDEKLDMMMNMLQDQKDSSKKAEATLEEHTRQISQLTNSMNELRMQQPGLPSQVQVRRYPLQSIDQKVLIVFFLDDVDRGHRHFQ